VTPYLSEEKRVYPHTARLLVPGKHVFGRRLVILQAEPDIIEVNGA
jgi:hypothetical protein